MDGIMNEFTIIKDSLKHLYNLKYIGNEIQSIVFYEMWLFKKKKK